MSIFYESPRMYIQSSTTIKDKICRIDSLITALEDAAIAAASGEDIAEYSLDDGQTKIRAVNRSALEIKQSIMAFEQMRQMYIQRYNGHTTRLVDDYSNRGSR